MLRQNFRKSSTIAALCSTSPSAHSRICNLVVHTYCGATPPRQRLHIRTSSHYGKTPIPTFPSLGKPRPSTPCCASLYVYLPILFLSALLDSDFLTVILAEAANS